MHVPLLLPKAFQVLAILVAMALFFGVGGAPASATGQNSKIVFCWRRHPERQFSAFHNESRRH